LPDFEQTDICGADGYDVQSALHFASDFIEGEVEVARKGNNGSKPNKNRTI